MGGVSNCLIEKREINGGLPSGSAELFKYIQCLGIIADEDDLILCLPLDSCQHPVQYHHLAGVPNFDLPVSSSGVLRNIIVGEQTLTPRQILRDIEQIWVIA